MASVCQAAISGPGRRRGEGGLCGWRVSSPGAPAHCEAAGEVVGMVGGGESEGSVGRLLQIYGVYVH